MTVQASSVGSALADNQALISSTTRRTFKPTIMIADSQASDFTHQEIRKSPIFSLSDVKWIRGMMANPN